MKSLSGKLGVILIGLATFGCSELCKAEGAWVLRVKSNIPTSRDWQIVSAFPKYEECIEKQKNDINKIKEIWGTTGLANITVWSSETMSLEVAETIYYYTLKCLPETIDPRK